MYCWMLIMVAIPFVIAILGLFFNPSGLYTTLVAGLGTFIQASYAQRLSNFIVPLPQRPRSGSEANALPGPAPQR